MARGGSLLILAVGLAPLGGCGLDDYERRMAEAQARVQRFDQINAGLGAPLEMPSRRVRVKTGDKEEEREQAWDVFVRPPLGIQSRPGGEPREGLLYHYPRQGTTASSVSPPGSTPGGPAGGLTAAARNVTDVYLAFSSSKPEPAAFAAEVLRLFPTAPNPPAPVSRNVNVADRGLLTFHAVEFDDDQASYAAFFYRPLTAATAVAMVYRFGRGQFPAVKPVLELSLGTLGVDQEVGAVRQLFGRPAAVKAPPPQ
jgi:hypothetical protein